MLIIRLATLQDIHQLAILFDAYRIFYEKDSDIEAARLFLTERIERKESQIFVAEENNSLLGFTQLYPLFSSTQMKRLWLLNDLFIADNQRGRKISVLLIDAAKELCQTTNACGIMLETAKTNLIGNQLYLKTDFQLDTTHHYYYWQNR